MNNINTIQFELKTKTFFILLSFLIISTKILAQSYEIGHTTVQFYDDERSRNVETEIYYPANTSGEDVQIESGGFPVIVFGHGFLIGYEAYQSFWDELVPIGYVLCFPTTEMGISPSHESFALDLKFTADQMQIENNDNSSMFFNALSSNIGLMGHSMGGGASFLAAENNPSISSLITFAPAETNPSAITAAANISSSALIFSGEDDCISPPVENQVPMFNNLNSDCKTHINIINGGIVILLKIIFIAIWGNHLAILHPKSLEANSN